MRSRVYRFPKNLDARLMRIATLMDVVPSQIVAGLLAEPLGLSFRQLGLDGIQPDLAEAVHATRPRSARVEDRDFLARPA